MLNIALIYFSGTGNTKLITKKLGESFTEKSHSIKYFELEELMKNIDLFNIDDFDIIGFSYPVHAFGIPLIYKQFMEILPKGKNKKTFILKTMGDPMWHGGSNINFRKMLIKKDYDVFYETDYVMQSNLAIKYSDELIKKLYNFALEKVKYDSENILNYKKSLLNNGFFIDLISTISNSMEHFGSRFISKLFYTDKNCNLCTACVKSCPSENIKIKNNKIKFGANCTFCMRCFYICPQNSINTKLALKIKNFEKTENVLKKDISENAHKKGSIENRIDQYIEDFRKNLLNK